MGDRIFDIKLSCGCMVSLDCGGALMPCDPNGENPDCKYKQEYMDNPRYPEWEKEIERRNRW